jgi:DNA modification methylase
MANMAQNNGHITTAQYSISDLIFAEYNPRELTKDQHQDLKDSITRFGLVDPLIVNIHKERKNILVGGHQRLRIAKELGYKSVSCVEVELTPEKEKELNVRLNKNTGQWDWDALANHFDVGELLEWGFSEDELQFTEPDVQGLTDDDDVPEVEETITQQGDLWILGEHRLLCGDATKKEDVERLMDGQKADMVFTDPPYALFGNSTGVTGITDDKMVRPFFRDVFNLCRNNTKLYSHIYVCCDWHSAFSLEGVAKDVKLTPKNLCIWDKGDGGIGAMYQQCYEMIWFFANSPIKTTTTGRKLGESGGERTVNGKPNIWRHNRATSDRKHNAQKPVEMMASAINNSSDIGGTCIDPFLGSGSTLIACEKTNRKCYGMEIDPHYCDVIVKRWEDYTGNKAERFEAANA